MDVCVRVRWEQHLDRALRPTHSAGLVGSMLGQGVGRHLM